MSEKSKNQLTVERLQLACTYMRRDSSAARAAGLSLILGLSKHPGDAEAALAEARRICVESGGGVRLVHLDEAEKRAREYSSARWAARIATVRANSRY